MASAALKRGDTRAHSARDGHTRRAAHGDEAAVAVRVEYRLREGVYEVVVRGLDGAVLCASSAETPATALHAAMAVLGHCTEAGYRVVALEPFPWAVQAMPAAR